MYHGAKQLMTLALVLTISFFAASMASAMGGGQTESGSGDSSVYYANGHNSKNGQNGNHNSRDGHRNGQNGHNSGNGHH